MPVASSARQKCLTYRTESLRRQTFLLCARSRVRRETGNLSSYGGV